MFTHSVNQVQTFSIMFVSILNYMRAYLIILSLFTCLSGFSQLIKRDAVIYSKAGGDSLFMLMDSSNVHLGSIENSWYPTSRVALVPLANWNEGDSTIAAGTELINEDKKVIGKTIQSFKAHTSRKGEGRRWKKHVWVLIDGYIHNNHIHYKSIPEKSVEKLVNAKNRAGLYDKLKEDVFDEFGFERYESGEYSSYVYLDKHITLEEEKPYRVIVVFRGETSLFCIITNDLPFELVKMKDQRSESSGNYYFVMKASPRMWEAVEDIAYTFIPL